MPVATAESVFNYMNTDDDKDYHAYERDIAIAHFYFDSSTIFQYSRQNRLTLTAFISQIGGVLGLCIGFSIVSLVELAYWFLYRLLISLTAVNGGGGKNSSSPKSKYSRYKKRSNFS
jgi:uncharacterized membrane protein